MIENRVLVANITWNGTGWKNIYINQKAGHKYARKYPGHESLNFDFAKKKLDEKQDVYGFIRWTARPKRLSNKALIIFYSKNLDRKRKEGEIIGIYGDVNILEEEKVTKWPKFENNELVSNVTAKKELSILFPIRLKSSNYSRKKRLVPQMGYTYKSIEFAEKIITDEIEALQRSGIGIEEYKKLLRIYKFITGRKYTLQEEQRTDLQEQEELLPLVTKDLGREQIIQELQKINAQTPEQTTFKGRRYKRDNKSIVQLKLLRGFKCQMCGLSILKKDKSYYIEAAHITDKKRQGPETPDNILILCPNHHKEFDWGDKKIIKRKKETIIFDLNSKRYQIDLSLR